MKAEIKHEEDAYEQSKEIKQFLKNTDFELVDVEGDVNMMLKKQVGDKVVQIDWQLTSPFEPNADAGEDEGFEQEATDFMVTLENQEKSADEGDRGLVFYCSTQAGEDHRYVIGSVKVFNSTEEKEGMSMYNGPDFEDLDEKLQEAFDEYLAELGLNSELCDFIDATALDKEQREYIHWLKVTKDFLEL